MLNKSKSVVVVEAPGLIRDCMCATLSEVSGLEVMGVSDEFEIAMSAVAALLPLLVVISTSILRISPIDFIRRVKRRYPGVLVLAFIRGKDSDMVSESLRAGADGYILDRASNDEFGAAIRSALRGESFTAAGKSASVLSADFALMKKSQSVSCDSKALTTREREVLALVASAQSNKTIAKCLSLSVNTVEKHRASLMKKLGVHNAAGLTAHAIATGLASARSADELARTNFDTASAYSSMAV